jgi:predicted DNA-binding transcriptional regulator AlpA
MSKTESEWLAGGKLAEYLGVSAMAIWRWERDERLAFPKPTVINTRKYWSRGDIDRWMRRQATSKAETVA